MGVISSDFVHVAEKFAPDSPARLISSAPVKIPLRGTVRVMFSVPRYSPFDVDQVQLLDPPEGITLKDFSVNRDRVTLVLEADAAKVTPGQTGNLIAIFVTKDKTPPGAPKKNPLRVPLGALPAIPYVVGGKVADASGSQ